VRPCYKIIYSFPETTTLPLAHGVANKCLYFKAFDPSPLISTTKYAQINRGRTPNYFVVVHKKWRYFFFLPTRIAIFGAFLHQHPFASKTMSASASNAKQPGRAPAVVPRTVSAPPPQGLYHPSNEHDACGVGFLAHIKGRQSHAIIQQGLKILENLDHRGAVGADELMGDGAGILLQIPDALYREEMAKQGVELPPPDEYGVAMVFL